MESNQILNGFKRHNVSEISKGILNPNFVNAAKYDIFSQSQVNTYLGSVIAKNEGVALEIQKSVVAAVKQELSHLIPVNIKHNGSIKKFYISKIGACSELCKAVEPVNKQEGYFDNNIDEQEVLDFISDNENVEDEMLIKNFGKGIEDVLNDLEKEGKIDIDDEGHYLIAEDNESNENEDNEDEEEDEDDEKDDEEEDENDEDEDDEEEDENDKDEEGNSEDKNKDGEYTNVTAGGNIKTLDETSNENKEDDENESSEGEENEEENEDENNDEDKNEEIVNYENDNNKNKEEENEEDNDIEDKKNKEINDESTPEELEAMAKKTATVSLLKFYKNSSDKKLKEVAAVELKSRGINLDNEEGVESEGDNNLPDNKAALDELEKWTKDYLGKYDKDDLIQYVVNLANQSPAKRKELKDFYREYYSASNAGNKALKIDENDFKDFLTEHYFNNFTPGDLQSYAYLLISKNPKEYRKFKKLRDDENEPII